MFARFSAAGRDEGGFTLIELLVVIIIIGILAAIALPVFLNQRASAGKASLVSDARIGAVEIEAYFSDHQAYPDDLAAVTALNPTVSATNVVAGYTTTGSTFTYCVEATVGPATGWSVTYNSVSEGLQPQHAVC